MRQFSLVIVLLFRWNERTLCHKLHLNLAYTLSYIPIGNIFWKRCILLYSQLWAHGGLVAHRQWLCSRGEWFIFCLDFREFKSKKSDNFATVHGCAAKLSFSKNPRDLRNYFLENNFFTSEKTCQKEIFKLKCFNPNKQGIGEKSPTFVQNNFTPWCLKLNIFF